MTKLEDQKTFQHDLTSQTKHRMGGWLQTPDQRALEDEGCLCPSCAQPVTPKSQATNVTLS